MNSTIQKQASGLNSKFTQTDLNFSNYIADIKNIIRRSRHDLNGSDKEVILEANSPFEMRPENYDGEKAILLVHGLLDSPFTLRDIGEYFLKKGFLVRAILLPGHGTVPGDLLETNELEWIKASEFGMKSLRKEARKIYYFGFSTGGSLGLYHALSGETLEGLIVIAPALKLKPLIHYPSYFLKWIRYLFKWDKWIFQKSNYNYAKYQYYPAKLANDLEGLIQKINHFPNAQLQIPLFMVLSEDDETIDSQAAVQFFLKQKNPKNHLIYYSTLNISFEDERITVLNSVYKEKNILSFSHICLPVSPDNVYYGEQGEYQDSVYKNAQSNACIVYKGALNLRSKKYSAFQRLTYNPDFEGMMERITRYFFI
jgi:esterase/lipase